MISPCRFERQPLTYFWTGLLGCLQKHDVDWTAVIVENDVQRVHLSGYTLTAPGGDSKQKEDDNQPSVSSHLRTLQVLEWWEVQACSQLRPESRARAQMVISWD